jgi:hypothetical protein
MKLSVLTTTDSEINFSSIICINCLTLPGVEVAGFIWPKYLRWVLYHKIWLTVLKRLLHQAHFIGNVVLYVVI